MKANVRTYKDIKICVYAMAASEPEEFIDRWLDSMAPADYITVLITKDPDPNYEYFLKKQQLPQFKNKLIVEKKAITPWRFDTARNESMKLIPVDKVDACVCTDIDEILIPDFWDDYRKMVFEHPNFERIFYQYAWSHDSETNEPKWFFWYDKTHKPKGWKWDYPVHEALTCPDKEKYGYEGFYCLDKNKIYLHHYPDQTKSRGSYLGLLELRAEEYPDDLYGLYYLQREYALKFDFEKALKTCVQLYSRLRRKEVKDDMMMFPSTCVCIGNYAMRMKMLDDAEFFFRKAIVADPWLRDGYIRLAQLYAYTGHPQQVYELIEKMEKESKRIDDWRTVSYFWRDWKKYQILADAKCWENDLPKAKEYFDLAFADIKTEDDKKDAKMEGLYHDYEWYEKKMADLEAIGKQD